MKQRFRKSLLQLRAFLVCSMRRQEVSAQHEEQREHEYEKRYDHCRLLLEEDAWQLHAASLQPFRKPWPNTRRTEPADDCALLIDAGPLVLEDFLHGDRFAFHAGDF